MGIYVGMGISNEDNSRFVLALKISDAYCFVSAALQFQSVLSIGEAALVLTSSPIVFCVTFTLRHMTLLTLRASAVRSNVDEVFVIHFIISM